MATKTTISDKKPGAADRELQAGSRLGDFEIVSLLGRGGMGAVYLAVKSGLDRKVAIKTLNSSLASNPGYVERFMNEARTATQVPPHSNVVSIYDIGTHEEQPFIVMEYVEGNTLASMLSKATLSLDRAAELLQRICRGVSAIHERGIVHRDLKPGNIIIGEGFRNTREPKILDFGIAKELGASPITGDGHIVGTQLYLSPEQVRGDEVDARSDVYALGVIMYECLVGKTPHDGKPIHQWVNDLVTGRFVLPSELLPGLPPALDVVLSRALSVDPARRYASAYEFGAALLPFAGPNTQKLWGPYYTTHDLAVREQMTGPIQSTPPPEAARRSGSQGPPPLPRPQSTRRLESRADIPSLVGRREPASGAGGAFPPRPANGNRHATPSRREASESGRTGGSAIAGSSFLRTAMAVTLGVMVGGLVIAIVWTVKRQPVRTEGATVVSEGPATTTTDPAAVAGPARPIPPPAQPAATPPPQPAPVVAVALPPPAPAVAAVAATDGAGVPVRPHPRKRKKPPEERPAAPLAGPAEIEQLITAAERAFQSRNFADSVRLSKKAIAAGASVDANLILAKTYLNLDRYRDARDQYNLVLQKDRNNSSAIKGLKLAIDGLGLDGGGTAPAADPTADRPRGR